MFGGYEVAQSYTNRTESLIRDGYVFFLRHVALTPFTPEQLLAMGRQEWERSIVFEAIAQERAKGIPEHPLFPDQATPMDYETARAEAIFFASLPG